MKIETSVKELEPAKINLELNIASSELEQEYNKLIAKYSTSVSMPGFRKGKVPANIIVKRFGDDLKHESIQEVLPKAIEKGIKDHSLETIGPAELTENHPPLSYPEGEFLKVSVVLNRKPSCTIKNYDNLKIDQVKYVFSDEDIKVNKDRILQSLGKAEELESYGKAGDMVHLNLDFHNPELVKLNLKNHIVVFDEKNRGALPHFLDELFEEITTMKPGETKELEHGFSETTDEEKLKNQTEKINLQVTRISRFKPAELTKEILDRLEVKDEAALDEKIRKDIEDYAKNKANEEAFSNAIIALKSNVDFIIPEIAVLYYLQNSWDQMVAEITQRQANPNIPKEPPAAWIEENKEHARKRIEDELVINKAKEDEKIDVGEDELETKIKELAKENKMDFKDYRREMIKSGAFSEIKRQSIHKKTLESILSKCSVNEVKEIPFAELQKQSQQRH